MVVVGTSKYKSAKSELGTPRSSVEPSSIGLSLRSDVLVLRFVFHGGKACPCTESDHTT